MADLLSIPGLGKTSLELLEAAGFHDVDALSRVGAEDLVRELERANSILGISKRAPGRAVVAKWIATAREQAGLRQEPAGPSLVPVDYEKTPQVISMLSASPFAIPLPARLLVENQLGVSDIPAGILLNRYSGDLDVRVDERLPKNRQPKPPASSGYVQLADSASQKLEIDTSRIKSINDMDDALPRMAAVKTSPANDRVALIRAPRSDTNRGRSPESRWYIRGVLHSHPVSIYVGAFFTLLLMVLLPVAILSGLLLLASAELPGPFAWVPPWLLWFPATLPLFGIAWVIWGLHGSCRICGQKLFMHRSHLKNAKAHRVRGLGYIIPLCFQILLFRWFRCTHCGTPVRLKE
jgi:Domain of unknown function (DUF4332)